MLNNYFLNPIQMNNDIQTITLGLGAIQNSERTTKGQVSVGRGIPNCLILFLGEMGREEKEENSDSWVSAL